MKIDNHDIGDLNNGKELTLEVVTPTHVGGASEKKWIRNLDFFFRERHVCIVNQNKLFEQLESISANNHRTGLDVHSGYMKRGEMDKIETYLSEEITDWENITLQKFEHGKEKITANEIRSVIRTGGKPFIPGSSIKGAIRSVLFSYLYHSTGKTRYADELEATLLGKFDNSIMRYIRPGDAEFSCTDTELINVKLFNLVNPNGNWKSELQKRSGFPLCVETFRPKRTTTFKFDIATGFINQYKMLGQSGKAHPILPDYWSSLFSEDKNKSFIRLFELINLHTQAHLNRELAFFKTYHQAKNSNLIIDSIENVLLPATHSADSCLLRLAFGTGFHGITGDYRFEDHSSTILNPDMANRKKNRITGEQEGTRYKSRRLADNLDMFAPMGFVKLILNNK